MLLSLRRRIILPTADVEQKEPFVKQAPVCPYPSGDIPPLAPVPSQSMLKRLLVVLGSRDDGNDPLNCARYEGYSVFSIDKRSGGKLYIKRLGPPGYMSDLTATTYASSLSCFLASGKTDLNHRTDGKNIKEVTVVYYFSLGLLPRSHDQDFLI